MIDSRAVYGPEFSDYLPRMIIIRFPNEQMEIRGLGYLAGRFSGKTFANGDTIVPEEALGHLAAEGIEFTVKGRPSYEDYAPLRDFTPAPVQ